MKSARDLLIVTNNPLVEACMGEQYQTRLFPEGTLREVLVAVRDLVYEGHALYTHPLSGSLKPNETPYKSVAVSKTPKAFSAGEAEMIASAILTLDKFAPRTREIGERAKADFQLVDYTLIAGALDFDAAAGLSKIQKQ